MMKFWVDDEDNYDDFEDNLTLVTTIYKFNASDLQLIKKYLQKYKQLKHIEWLTPSPIISINTYTQF